MLGTIAESATRNITTQRTSPQVDEIC